MALNEAKTKLTIDRTECRLCMGELVAHSDDNIEEWGDEWYMAGEDDWLWVRCNQCFAADWLKMLGNDYADPELYS